MVCLSWRDSLATIVFVVLASAQAYSQPFPVSGIDWVRQFGGKARSGGEVRAVAADGDVYATGMVHGSLPGQPSSNTVSLFLRKYNSSGQQLWTRQQSNLGPLWNLYGFGVYVDDSGVYVVGMGEDQDNYGAQVVFVEKWDKSGGLQWSKGLTNPGEFSSAAPSEIAGDATGIYVAGSADGKFLGQVTQILDAFVTKLDKSGNVLWTKLVGTASYDEGLGLGVDATGIYLAGNTGGALPGQTYLGGGDAFVRRFNTNGNELWTWQFGTGTWETAYDVHADAAGVYITGYSTNPLPGQTLPYGFLQKRDLSGSVLWTSALGGTFDQRMSSYPIRIARDNSGVYISGAAAQLPGESGLGGLDMFVRKYDFQGNVIWTKQTGSPDGDAAYSIAASPAANLILLGGAQSPGWCVVRAYHPSGAELWTDMFDSEYTTNDAVHAVDAAGNIYVLGDSGGKLQGQAQPGTFIRKYDPQGNELWTKMIDSGYPESWSTETKNHRIAADLEGVFVILGHDYWVWSAGPKPELRKFDTNGNLLWAKITQGYSLSGLALDASGVYATQDDSLNGPEYYLVKWDRSGNELWRRQIGSYGETINAFRVAADSFGVYAGGTRPATPFGPSSTFDFFIKRFDTSGNELWSQVSGTPVRDYLTGISTDSIGVYLTGLTLGAFPGFANSGGNDVFVRKYSSGGVELWTRQFGTSGADIPAGISARSGAVYVAGATAGVLPRQTGAGGSDVFARKYDPDGNERWTRQVGTTGEDEVRAVAADDLGVYIGGVTLGVFPGQTGGPGRDAFVMRMDRDDRTPPKIVPSVTGTLGLNNWYVGPVTVSWTVSDVESAVASMTGCGPITLNADTAGTQVTCTAANGDGYSASMSVNIRIDRTPPTIAGMPVNCVLRPVNHKLMQVAAVSANGAVSGLAALSVSVSSNEPVNGLGDGNAEPDWIVTGGPLGPLGIQLRAERSGTGSGRIYTIHAVAQDFAGNSASATAACTVPHDSR